MPLIGQMNVMWEISFQSQIPLEDFLCEKNHEDCDCGTQRVDPLKLSRNNM